MIPIRAQARVRTKPFVTWLLAITCAAVLARLAFMPSDRAERVVSELGVVPARLLGSPLAAGQWATLLTSAFLHAGWIHLAGNLLYLLVFGPTVEGRLGHLRFLGLYAAAGAAGALAHSIAHPTSTIALVGASGAIAGVLAAHLVLEPQSKITTAIPIVIFVELATLPAAFVIAFWVLLQLASAFAPVAQGADFSVAWFAHLGGFALGIAYCGPGAIAQLVRALGSGRAR